MELEQQLKLLIADAANQGVPVAVMELAIAPVLKMLATQLQHDEYYIIQNSESDWVLTTIANAKLKQHKKVIYAFVTVRDAATFQGKSDPDLIAVPISVTQLLFRLFSLHQVDSIIFMNDSSNLNNGIEVLRNRFLDLIQQQIEKLKQTPPYIA